MKCILVLLALSVLSITSTAQQSDLKKSAGELCGEHAFTNTFHENVRCQEIQKQEEKQAETERAAKVLELKEKADELKRAVDDANKVRSADKGTQIEGITDVVKDMNSHANNNPASRVVTEKSLSVIDRFAQMENESLNNTENAIKSGSKTETGSTTPYGAGGHELHESTKNNVESQPLTIEQRYQQQDQTLMSGPSVRSAVAEAEPTKSIVGSHVSVKERYNNQENSILLSPSNVKAVADAERARQKAEEERLALEAKKEAERRAEIYKQAIEQAEAQRIAKIERDRAAAADDAAEEREERREAAREAREQRAAWNAMFGPPSYVPNTPSYYSPNLPAYVPSVSYATPVLSYGTYLPSDNSSYLPQNGSSGSDLDFGATRAISSPNSFDAFSCMSNLSTESQCLRDHIKPIELSPGCFDDPGSFALPSCVQGIYGGSSNSASPTPPAPAADASLAPSTTPPAASTTAPKTAK